LKGSEKTMKISQREGISIDGTTIASTNLVVVDDSGGIYGNGIFARSGTTGVRIASSTGQLYQKGEALTFKATDINNVACYNAYTSVAGATGPISLGGTAEIITGGAVAGGSSEVFMALPAIPALGAWSKIVFRPASSSARLSLSAGASSNAFIGTSSNNYLFVSTACEFELTFVSSSIWWINSTAAGNMQSRSGSTT
jgi:hypothetical protein